MHILKTSGEIERLTQLMKGLSAETDDAKRRMEALGNTQFIFDLALKSPFEVKSIQDAFVKLIITTQQL